MGTTSTDVFRQFASPPRSYGPITFWAWNDRLEEAELVRQIGLMDEAGWAGFFMHSRVGLETPYLSRRWFDCIKVCVQEAGRRGMTAWIYDEDQWPSGFAGGIVPALSPHFRAKALWCLVDDKPTHIAERLGTWTAKRGAGGLVDFRPETGALGYEPDTDAWVQIYPVTTSLNQARHKGYCYADVLCPEAVRAFVDCTYEAYAREIGEYFGNVVPGIFTDEPQYLRWDWYAGTGIQNWYQGIGAQILPWTDGLPELFRSRYGYDLLPALPSLYFDTGDFTRVRHDFWECVTRRFVDSYTHQIQHWCHEHNLVFAGHLLREDSLDDQIRGTGAVMPHYEHFDYPAIDKLGRHIDQPLTAKQVDSVSCQLGKIRTVGETYSCAGQDFGFTGRKWVGDQLYALGINLLNPCLSLYSMRGERKRDFPPNLFYQQPWWHLNRQFDDYFTRLSYLLSQGTRVVDVLVLHPMQSAWLSYRPAAPHGAQRLSTELRKVSDVLLAEHRDYHLGDESILRRYGSVHGNRLHIGNMAYRLVIVPPCLTLSKSTVDLLHELVRQGGKVMSVGEQPHLVDGMPADSVLPAKVLNVANARSEIAGALARSLEPDVTISGEGADDVIYHHRRIDTLDVYFVVNQNLSVERQVDLLIAGHGAVERWDPFTGTAGSMIAQTTGGNTTVRLALPAAGSCVLVAAPQEAASRAEVASHKRDRCESVVLANRWVLRRRDPNVMVLDACRLSLDGEPWSEPMPVWRAHREVMRSGPGAKFSVQFEFQVDVVPESVDVVLEQPWRYRIQVNRQPLAADGDEYYRDISFRRIDITGLIVQGNNRIALTGVFDDRCELEAVYLTGDFSVRATRLGPEKHGANGMDFDRYSPVFTLGPEAASGDSRRLNDLGYPFFAGTMGLVQTVDIEPAFGSRASLVIEGMHAIAAEVLVNGRPARAILVPPHETEITELIHPGDNVLEIRLVSSLRNMLGPLHRTGGDPEKMWPYDFTDASGLWTDDYILVPFGFDKATIRCSTSGGTNG